jgi:hypothetical protein
VAISIHKEADLYFADVTPPHRSWVTTQPMFRGDLFTHLHDLGCRAKDICDAFYVADPNWRPMESNGMRLMSGRGIRHVPVHGWRRMWYQRVAVNTVVFHVLAWFNCSVPGTKGRLDRLMSPASRP